MSLFIFASCENFMDIHQEYIEGGEIIYASKPLAIQFNAGFEQIQFLCLMENAINVKTIDVYYTNKDNKKDSLIIPVSLSTGYQIVDAMLTDMGEKSYTFTVRTTDINGNKSLNTSGVGTSYGEVFMMTLADRLVNVGTLIDGDNNIEVSWSLAPGYLIGTEMVYKKNNGVDTTVFIPSTENVTSITDAAPVYIHPNTISAEFKYRSLYMYEPTAMDTVYGNWLRSSFFSLWLSGNATTAGWVGNVIPMPYNPENPGVFEYLGPLTGGNRRLRFLTIRNDFSTYNVRPLVVDQSIQVPGLQIYSGTAAPFGDWAWLVQTEETGTYKITVNLNEMKVYFEKQ
jgi:hypothetical protein